MASDLSLFPIIGWEARPVPSHGAVLIRFQYLSSPKQSDDKPHTSPLLAMTRQQTVDLIRILQKQLDRLEKDLAEERPKGPLH
jgi:hypothetical protein